MAQSRPFVHSDEPEFHPPHCPNSSCPDYIAQPDWRPARDGYFRRPSDSRLFQRFRCPHCSRRFSTRTFAADYWLKRRDLFPEIARLSTEGPGLRQIARLLGLSHTTVMRHLARAGRHCLIFHRQLIANRSIDEPIVIDGFESFEFSQFFPFHFNVAVASQSWFLLHFTDSPLRRKGTMKPEQRLRRDQLERRFGRPDPKAVEKGVYDLLLTVLRDPRAQAGSERLIHSDDHPAYRRALRSLRKLPDLPRLRHQVTSSMERRTMSNPLFPVNLTDLLLRHGQANHRRETIAFSKRRQAAMERLAVFTVWRNAIKSRRENRPGETAAMAAGLLQRPLEWVEAFARRLFPRQRDLPGPWQSYYWGRIRTAALGPSQRRHQLRYAF